MTRVGAQTRPAFYMTAPAPCPYLPDRTECKVFTPLPARGASLLNETLTLNGFRRSQNVSYRPACSGCNACVSVRIPVADFQPGKRWLRVLSRNRDLVVEPRRAIPTEEQFALLSRYLASRHAGGGMDGLDADDYASMIGDGVVKPVLFEYRLVSEETLLSLEPAPGRPGPTGSATIGQTEDWRSPGPQPTHQALLGTASEGQPGQLVAVMIVDTMKSGLSLIYSFYDPDMTARSLGNFMVLDQVRLALQHDLPHVYLGYWVEGSEKMAYKADYAPLEFLTRRGWQRGPWQPEWHASPPGGLLPEGQQND